VIDTIARGEATAVGLQRPAQTTAKARLTAARRAWGERCGIAEWSQKGVGRAETGVLAWASGGRLGVAV